MRDRIAPYFDTLFKLTTEVECSERDGASVAVANAYQRVCDLCHAAHERGNKIMFIGNGGSAGITGHMAVDFSKNGKMRATAFNDGSMLTALGNDYGYEFVFAKQIEWQGRAGDVLIAISSSGKSPNILKGVEAARAHGCDVVTFSGFGEDNPLRQSGDVNFYVRSREYGFVEVAHQAIIHAILDLDMGWTPES